MKKTDKVIVGWSRFEDDFIPRQIGLDDYNYLVCGEPGSGKSTTWYWPMLKRYAGSMAVDDPKGEHYRETHRFRPSSIILDGYGETGAESQCWNPLDQVDIESDTARPMLSAISDALVVNEGGDGRHFSETARLLLEGLIAHIKSTEPPENQNLAFIFDQINGINEDGFADPEKFDALLTEMRMSSVCGGIAAQGAAMLEGMGDRERGGVISTLYRALKWAGDPVMRKQMSRSDFSYMDLVTEPGTTVYKVLPTHLMGADTMRWSRLHLSLGIRVMQGAKKKPKHKIMMCMDEFPKISRGGIEVIEDGAVTLRAAGIALAPAIQSLAQLQRDFPRSWQALVGSSALVFFGVSDMATAEYVSKRLGEKLRVRKEGKLFRRRVVHEMPRPLMTPTEVIKELQRNSDMQIVIPSTGLPMRLRRQSHKSIKVEGRRFFGLPERWQLKLAR